MKFKFNTWDFSEGCLRIYVLNFAKQKHDQACNLSSEAKGIKAFIVNDTLHCSQCLKVEPICQESWLGFFGFCLFVQYLKVLGPPRQIPFALFLQSNSLTVSKVFCICAKIFLLDCIQDLALETHPILENPNRCTVITFLTKSRH